MGKLLLCIIIGLLLVYVCISVISSIWLRHIVVSCNISDTQSNGLLQHFSDESLMKKLDYRNDALHLTQNPSFDIQVSFPLFLVRFGHAQARFYVTWNGYEELLGQRTHRVGVYKQPVDVCLQWENGKWVITNITRHEFIK